MRDLFSRLAWRGSMLGTAMLLAACGGGEAESDDAVAAMPASALSASENRQALATERPQAATAQESGSDAVMSFDPQPWELEEDEATSQAFLTSLQPSRQAAEAASWTRVKWNPGHYVALSRRGEAALHEALREIKHLPHVKGLLLRYGWRQLEPRKGEYQFATIDRDLALARSYGKQLFIMVETKAFKAGVRAVPDYMHTAEYSGGAYKIRINAKSTLGSPKTYGENAALHNPKVRDRLIALTTALGRRYNYNNNFEGITFNETAMGQMLQPLSKRQTTDFFTHLAQVNKATKRAFPNTVVMQFINFPQPYMAGLVSNMLSSSVGLGGPDTFLNDHDLNRLTYPFYDKARGKVPIGPSVQPENYFARSHNGPHAPPRVQELHAFAQNRLHANYLFWSKTLIQPLVPYRSVLRMFNSEAFPRGHTGGLNADCPASFGTCVRKL
ncbi:glycoside hydrolase [Azohydromonas caseinilytica]|uniref:Glycoside hydrolase n=1 Tax=Azohydromonas caseinilytica TaxID=2728836 RepID=A0A848FFA0_9BURK|nr:glycoside hydrolase [Azohydromonas caseinilytica]NML17786.1 glycoside hydrolase [Azohydromonas caseinilytica]